MKVLKPIFASLRARGVISTAYIDDSCLQGASFEECSNNTKVTENLMDPLGFTVHSYKSVLFPTKQIVFLGFLLCSDSMTVGLTPKRKNELLAYCKALLNKSKCTIRKFAKVASEPGVEHAPLFYKPLEKIKEFQFQINKGNFNWYIGI